MMTDTKATETRTFEADVSRLLHMMVHSVYSDRDVFLRELISCRLALKCKNAAVLSGLGT